MDEILARLERIEQRLDALEARGVRAAVAPPMILSPRPPLQDEPLGEGAMDLEAALGARWLPRAGATAVIAAIAYLVGLGLQRGIVTPASVAVGIALVCVAVALLGARMKEAREAFGNVLVGLGAGGLYVDAVGSNLYHEMLSGEAMVAACVAISLTALGFGARRGLPSFLGIGHFGGLLAAVMPLAKGNGVASAGLLLLVAAPAFAVGALRRWPLAVAGSWGAAFLGALAVLYSDGDLVLRFAPLDATLLMALAAWAWAAEPMPKQDPYGAFPFVAALATGAAALGAYTGVRGAGHVELMGCLVSGIGFALASRTSGKRVRLAGIVLITVVAPLGFAPATAAWALAGLATFGTVAALLWLRSTAMDTIRVFGTLAAVQAAFALGCHAYAALSSPDIAYEPGLLTLLALAATGAAVTLDFREARVVAGVVVWGLATRFAVLATDWPRNAAITAAWLAVFAGLLALGFVRRRPELRQLGLVVAAATAGKVVLVDLAGLDAALKAVVLMGLGLALLGGGYAYVRWAASERS